MSPLIFNILIDVLRPRLPCSHNHFPLLTPGDPSVFVRLIHDGQLRLDQVEDHTEDELRGLLDQCGQSVPSGATKVGDEPSARHRCLFIAITSKVDDHKTRQGHKYPPCQGEAVQVSCDKSNPSWLRPGGLVRNGVKALFVSFTWFTGLQQPFLWESFYTSVISVSPRVRANCWPLSSPCTRGCTAASPRRRSPRLTSQPASCPSSARTR